MSANALTGRGDQKISRWRQLAGWSPSYVASQPCQQHIRRLGIVDFPSLRLQENSPVVVSFDSVQTATSSFLHAAFVALLDHYSYSDLKVRLHIVDSTRQINTMIKTRLERSGLAAA